MPPSASLQAKISAFEATAPAALPIRQLPKIARKPVMINPLEEPISPTVSSKMSSPMVPTPPAVNASVGQSPSPGPSSLDSRSSLIDLKDWVVEDVPGTSPRSVSENSNRLANSPSSSPLSVGSPPAPRITLQTVSTTSKAKAPPLPPRKPSYASLRSASAGSSTSVSQLNGSSTTLTRKPSDSLSPTGQYPPPVLPRSGHVQASSISSFHSVSLSSDGDPTSPNHRTSFLPSEETIPDDVSLQESFENVSPSSSAPSFDWPAERRTPFGLPRMLPPRSLAVSPPPLLSPTNSSSALSSAPTSPGRTPTLPYTPRRAPPVPPGRGAPGPGSSRASVTSVSDRSSVLSAGTIGTTGTASTSRTSWSAQSLASNSAQIKARARTLQTTRPTPVPPPARTRYETLFVANVRAQMCAEAKRQAQKGRKQGWRGVSVDLLTTPELLQNFDGSQPEVGPEERLEGYIVSTIWAASQLPRDKLKQIWTECDVASIGSLDREGFVKGMWRIDEELRRAEVARKVGRGARGKLSRTESAASMK